MQPRTLETPPKPVALLFAWVIVFPLLFLLWVRFWVPPIANDDLDPSWTVVLAHAFEQGWHWGRDVVFTYGPLGFLHPSANHWPALAGTTEWAQLAIAALLAFIGANLFVLVDNTRRLALVAAAIVFTVALGADALWIVATALTVLATAYRAALPGRNIMLYALVAVAAAFVAVVVCIKVSMITVGVLWLLATSIVLVSNRRPGAAIVAVVTAAATFTAVWLAAGQRLADAPAYFSWGFEFSAGYGATLSFFPVWWMDLAGGLVAAAAALLVLAALWANRRSVAWTTAIGFVGLALFLAWRLGFTRADPHTMIFFACVGCLVPQLPRIDGNVLRPTGIAAAVLGLIAIPLFLHEWSFDQHHTVRMALRGAYDQVRAVPAQLAGAGQRREQYRALSDAMRTQLALPDVVREVGSATIDLVGYQQARVLYNSLAYKPRPVFQSYAAYTPRLARLNEAFLVGPDAPDYMLLANTPIDGHLPASEDPLTLLALLRRYTPVLRENRFLLFRKVAAGPVAPVAPVALPAPAAPAKLGEWIDLPKAGDDDAVVLGFSAQLGGAGKLAALLVREPYWFLELQTEQGATLRFRTNREQGETGFLVSPLVNSLEDWLRLFLRQPLPRVTKFRLLPHSERLAFLAEPTFGYAATVIPAAQRSPPPAAGAKLVDSVYPGFNRLPDRIEGSPESIEENGRPALYLHAPASLSFDLAAGDYRFAAEVGVRAATLAMPECRAADGVVASVAVDGGEPLATLGVDPFRQPQQPNPARLEVPLSLARDGIVTVRLDIGAPGATGTCDWSYVRDLTIQPAPPRSGE